MLPLPDADFDVEDTEVLADWVELSALAEGDLLLSDIRDEIVEALPDAVDFNPRGGRRRDGEEEIPTDPADTLFDTVRPTIVRRRAEMRAGYPFSIDRTSIAVKDEGWRSHVVYTSLAMADLGRRYSRFKQGTRFRTLFERIVTSSLGIRLMGTTVRFGSPRENRDVPGAIGRRISWLSEKMDVSVNEANLLKKHSTGDEGLDVVGRFSFGDDLPGNIVLLVQCSTSAQLERVKKGEPALAKWEAFLNWNSLLVKAVATPFRLDPPRGRRAGELSKAFEHALILDRPRLCHARLDGAISPGTLRELRSWCSHGFSSIKQRGSRTAGRRSRSGRACSR
jgi:hypothetical protein